LYVRCCPRHPICHHLWSEHVEIEDRDTSEVEGMNTVEEHDHPTNHRLGEEGMDTVDEHYHLMNHRSEVEDMNTMEKHYHRSEVEGMDTVEEHYHRPEVKCMDSEDSGGG
jgi:hypothetical protein